MYVAYLHYVHVFPMHLLINNGLFLFLATAVFVAPDLRVYLIPDIIPMLCKMQGAVGDGSFHPRYEDSRTIYELFKLLIPPTINQNQSWVSGLNDGRGGREGETQRERGGGGEGVSRRKSIYESSVEFFTFPDLSRSGSATSVIRGACPTSL